MMVHVLYEGKVQGVGFRYTTRNVARQHELTGWVKNLPDGRVELKAQGSQQDLDDFLRDLDGHFEGFIRNKEIAWDQDLEKHTSFEITF